MTLLPFVYKETLHVLRDRRMLFVVLMIPVVQILIFGFAISTEVNNVNVAVTWQTYSEQTRLTIEKVTSNPYITLVGSVRQTDVSDVLRRGEADAVLFFNDADDVQIIADASNPNMAQSATNYLTAIINGDKAGSLIDTHLLYNPQLKSGYNFVPGIMGMIFLLVCALMTAVSIVREKESGTMELLLVSPVRPVQIIFSKMTPFFVLSCIDLTLILVIARYLLDVPLSSGILPVVAVSLLYIILALGFGLLVSTIAKNQVMAMLICGMVMIMPVIMLSGMVFPVDNLPVVLKQISAIVPARWYISAMRKLMIEGLDLHGVIDDVIVLSVMTVVIFTAALKKFKDRLA